MPWRFRRVVSTIAPLVKDAAALRAVLLFCLHPIRNHKLALVPAALLRRRERVRTREGCARRDEGR